MLVSATASRFEVNFSVLRLIKEIYFSGKFLFLSPMRDLPLPIQKSLLIFPAN